MQNNIDFTKNLLVSPHEHGRNSLSELLSMFTEGVPSSSTLRSDHQMHFLGFFFLHKWCSLMVQPEQKNQEGN